ncbi:MAG: glycosyltransferase [Actinobacteria bacterium]|nr:glycosyltransferase [Actinomycetota bacterium]
MHEVLVPDRDVTPLAAVIGRERLDRLVGQVAARARRRLGSARVLNVSSTGAGGGVAELMRVLLAYARSAQVDARWLVIDGDAAFFSLTKRIHNHLYGFPGDGGPLGPDEQRRYREVSAANAAALLDRVRPGDVVVLHDPQTAGLAAAVHEAGHPTIWRCHVGIDDQNEHSRAAWDFLRPHLEGSVDRYVFTLAGFAPDWVPRDRLTAVPPSIDPFAAKNADLGPEEVRSVLVAAGLLAGDTAGSPTFRRGDGTTAEVRRRCQVVREAGPPRPDSPLVVQVSRWDRMKDMEGVMRAFAQGVPLAMGAHLVLAGPSVESVADDPEGAEVFADCRRAWGRLDHDGRARIHLATLPMDDLEENGAIVNALQRHAAVVTQKSLAEGFGLTVTEALYKGRPVVASAVGGITDQIRDASTGILVDDPRDLDAFAMRSSGSWPTRQARTGWGGPHAGTPSIASSRTGTSASGPTSSTSCSRAPRSPRGLRRPARPWRRARVRWPRRRAPPRRRGSPAEAGPGAGRSSRPTSGCPSGRRGPGAPLRARARRRRSHPAPTAGGSGEPTARPAAPRRWRRCRCPPRPRPLRGRGRSPAPVGRRCRPGTRPAT